MPIQAFKTNTVKKKCVIINAKNFINDIALHSVFPLGHSGHLNAGTLFSHLDIKG
jgi:hypothetical protein